MKWEPVKQYAEIKRDSGVILPTIATGWRCTGCGLTHWSSPERPERPDGGCWSCHQRDEEYGKDALTEGPRGREVLGRIRTA